MPFNGSGVAEGVPRPAYPPAPGEIIYAEYFVTIISDLLTMLSNCVTRDGQSPWSQDIPANNKKLKGLAAGTSAGDALSFGQSGASFGSLAVTTITGTTTFTLPPNVPTGIDREGGNAAASQAYVETAATRAATEVIQTVNANANALAILTFIGA